MSKKNSLNRNSVWLESGSTGVGRIGVGVAEIAGVGEFVGVKVWVGLGVLVDFLIGITVWVAVSTSAIETAVFCGVAVKAVAVQAEKIVQRKPATNPSLNFIRIITIIP